MAVVTADCEMLSGIAADLANRPRDPPAVSDFPIEPYRIIGHFYYDMDGI